jgi:hypothetical protein
MNTNLQPVFDEVAYLLLKAANQRQAGITLHVVHRYSRHNRCSAGEDVAMVLIGVGLSKMQVPLGLSQRLLVDFLAQHPHRYYDAGQIAKGLATPFYRRHGENGGPLARRSRSIHRASVKTYIGRIRDGLKLALAQAGLTVTPEVILRSEKLSSNVVGYGLAVHVEVHHV